MTDTLRTAYDAVPYFSKPITQSFPPTLEAVGLAYGMVPPPSDRATILELGCAAGGNIISIAEQFPETRIVGIDLSPRQIAEGHALVDQLGLTNISLISGSIADIDDSFGQFDYIICHGVYSWVPPEVQDAILRVSSRNLSPRGIAFISYNTYPGWHVRGMVREMMMRHDDRTLPPQQRVARARALIEQLAAITPGKTHTVYQASLAEEAAMLRTETDAYILHEQLEPYNAPVYFSEFVERAKAHGLGYLAEAKLSSSTSRKPSHLASLVSDPDDVVQWQQYIDFARGRTFRRSLLCHEDVERQRWPVADQVPQMHFAINAYRVEPDADAVREAGTDVAAFETVDGARMTTNNPFIIGTLQALTDVAPGLRSFEDIVSRLTQLEADPESAEDFSPPAVRERLAPLLLECARAGVVEAYGRAITIERTPSNAPRAGAVARALAATQSALPSRRHYHTSLSDTDRYILSYLDGSRTREELTLLVTRAMAGATLPADVVGTVVDPARLVDETIQRLALHGMLAQ